MITVGYKLINNNNNCPHRQLHFIQNEQSTVSGFFTFSQMPFLLHGSQWRAQVIL